MSVVTKYGNIVDATEDVICQQTNCLGVMGSGVALAIRHKYPEVYEAYCDFCKEQKPEDLFGNTFLCDSNDGKIFANLFGQKNFGRTGQFTDYAALKSCMIGLATYAKKNDEENWKSFAFPYGMSCGTGGGDWNIVSQMIEEIFADFDIVYYKYMGEK